MKDKPVPYDLCGKNVMELDRLNIALTLNTVILNGSCR